MILAHEIIGSGEPLLFLHGLGADRRQSMDAFADASQEGAYQLIAVDFRSHGESIDDSDGDALNFDRFADDIIHLMDHLGLTQATIGGMSMGAGVSLNIALRYPERVQQLILLRPSWLASPAPPHLAIVAKIGHDIEEGGLLKSQRRLENSAEFLALQQREPRVAASLLPLFTRPQAYSGASVLYRMYESQPCAALSALQSIGHRVLILDTTHDDLHPQSVAKQIAAHLPQVSSHLTLPPRYREPERYQHTLSHSVVSFLSSSHITHL